MIALLISIVASSLLFVIFKLFDNYHINTLQAIVINYIVACSCGILSYDPPIAISTLPNYDWFYGSMLLGMFFILVFNFMVMTTQKNGISVVAVASKMSIAIPVIFGILVYNESVEFWKLTGISIAMTAVYLTSIKSNKGITLQKKELMFPALVFMGSGIIDTSLKYMETNFVAKQDVPLFSATIFAFAGCTGILVLGYQVCKGTTKLAIKNVLAGIVLGIPNYFSIYFLIQALRTEGIESATIFTINNVAILLVSTLLGILLFRERLIPKNWIGIGLAIISILLVATVA